MSMLICKTDSLEQSIYSVPLCYITFIKSRAAMILRLLGNETNQCNTLVKKSEAGL